MSAFIGPNGRNCCDVDASLVRPAFAECLRPLWLYDLDQIAERFQHGIGSDAETFARDVRSIHPVRSEPKDFRTGDIEEIGGNKTNALRVGAHLFHCELVGSRARLVNLHLVGADELRKRPLAPHS